VESIRVDRWLWSVRAFKTRSLATEACRSGHVAVNRAVTKPSTLVRVGDNVTIRVEGRDRVLEVARVIANRVGAPMAAECVIDRSPPAPPREVTAPGLVRDPATGRPTKRDRRLIDRLRER
jgi:ribosome-associated heat shock protein Hsp15